jgi:hypothetical protein
MPRVQEIQLVIDSRDRDTIIHPLASQYSYPLQDVLRNVRMIELTYALYAKHGIEMYTNLEIEEFPQKNNSANPHLLSAFAQLPLMEYINEVHRNDRTWCVCDPPIAKLAKLSIRFTDYQGKVYPMTDHLLRFRIECYTSVDPSSAVGNLITEPPTMVTREEALRILSLNGAYTNRDLNVSYKRERDRKVVDIGVLKAAYRVLKQA